MEIEKYTKHKLIQIVKVYEKGYYAQRKITKACLKGWKQSNLGWGITLVLWFLTIIYYLLNL